MYISLKNNREWKVIEFLIAVQSHEIAFSNLDLLVSVLHGAICVYRFIQKSRLISHIGAWSVNYNFFLKQTPSKAEMEKNSEAIIKLLKKIANANAKT